MKIKSITIYRFSLRIEPFAISTGTMDYAQNILIKIHTDNALEGLGECSAFPMIVGETQETCWVMAQAFAKCWIGKPALPIEERLQDLHAYAANNPTIKSAFDMALYDLAAKAAGVPLYHYLGGKSKTVESDITIGIGKLTDMVTSARLLVKKGAGTLKIKVGKDAAADVEKIAAIRQAIGPNIAIRIDANQGWGFREAIAALQAMEPLGVQFCEQPMKATDDALLYALRQAVAVPIMADESCYDARDARRLAHSSSCDYINIKLAKSGGLHEAMAIHAVSQKHNIPCMIGGMLESRLAMTANLHLACACPGIRFFDLDSPILGQLEDPILDGAVYDNYRLTPPELPGIGASVDPEYLKGCESVVI